MKEGYKFWIAFSLVPHIGYKRMKLLMKFFPTMENAYYANYNELIKAGLNANIVKNFLNIRDTIDINKEIDLLNREQIKVVTLQDDNYPKLLRQIYDPPLLLYYKGDISISNERTISVVGTRKNTLYGEQVTQEFIKGLVENNFVIVSGMAVGIDSIAHTNTLKHSGKTIAVIGSGLCKDKIYPKSNYNLSKNIVNNKGLILSEFPYNMPALKQNFFLRNRIISGLSAATLIIEAGERSGTLITANFALEQNREILTTPGSIFNVSSKGPNNLLKQGAKAVTCIDDILETLNIEKIVSSPNKKTIKANTKEEKIILEILSEQAAHIDDISRKSKIELKTLSSILLTMELENKIKNTGFMNYIIFDNN